MSIIRMQKVAVLGLDADKKRLMSELMDLGVVELTDCSAMSGEDFRNVNLTQDAAPETVEFFEKKVFDAAQALEVLEKYGEIKEPLFHTRRRTYTILDDTEIIRRCTIPWNEAAGGGKRRCPRPAAAR